MAVSVPRARVDYPRSMGEFQSWFASDADCLDYLAWLGWPDGFTCPECGSRDGWRVADGRYKCVGCGMRTSAQPHDEATEHPATSSATCPSAPSSIPLAVPSDTSIIEVLRRPVESAQYTSLAFTEALVDAGITGSIGTVGDALDNALMESTTGLFKTEVIDHENDVWTGWRHVEEATASWVHWYNLSATALLHRRRPTGRAGAVVLRFNTRARRSRSGLTTPSKTAGRFTYRRHRTGASFWLENVGLLTTIFPAQRALIRFNTPPPKKFLLADPGLMHCAHSRPMRLLSSTDLDNFRGDLLARSCRADGAHGA